MADMKRGKRDTRQKEERDFDQRIIDLARVTRVMAGGKRMRFRACVVLGDHKGHLGFGLGKGADVTLAVQKAATRARRDMITVPIINETIPHELDVKFKAARLLLKPAPKGTGVMAGGPVRMALELSGIGNIVAKVHGSKNKINNIAALFSALSQLTNSVSKRSLLTYKRHTSAPKKEVKEEVAEVVEEKKEPEKKAPKSTKKEKTEKE